MALSPNPQAIARWTTPVHDKLAHSFLSGARAVRESGLVPQLMRETVQIVGYPANAGGTIDEVLQDLKRMDVAGLVSGSVVLKGTPEPGRRRVVSLTIDFVSGNVAITGTQVDPATIRSIILPHLPQSTRGSLGAPLRASAAGGGGLAPGLCVDAYTLIERIGAGYSSEVWEAEVGDRSPLPSLQPSQRVALKCYLPHVLRERIESLRIQREFQLASEIQHPHIVRVHDLVMSPSRGYTFIAMDLVRGDTLKSRIPQKGMPLAEICAIGEQIFSALSEIHARRALHRDVKPSNIMVTSKAAESPNIVLLDLGIVSLASDPSLTNTSTFLGSKHTAPFEQLTGRAVDERSDIYAAGASLFHCYCGWPMYFHDGPEGGIVARMLREPEVAKLRKNGGVAEERFLNFLNSCISVDPADRPGSARDCVSAMREALVALAASPATG